MVLETKSNAEAGLVGSGQSFAGSRLDAQRSVAGWANELMGGVAYLDYIRGLVGRVESDWEGVQADLESIRCGEEGRGVAGAGRGRRAEDPSRRGRLAGVFPGFSGLLRWRQ